MSTHAVVSTQEVLDALERVLDPELDRSIVDLGFVESVRIRGDEVSIALRLPTYWCAPNFSWLMADDARQAVLRLPGVARVEVTLLDHHASAEISAGVSAGRSFQETFPGEATEELDALRRLFRRKAFFARQERLLNTLPRERLAELRLGDLPDTPETRAYLTVRAELGLDCSPDAPAVTGPDGGPVRDVDAYLRWIRLMRVSMEANTTLCRGLLAARYGEERVDEGSPDRFLSRAVPDHRSS